MWHTQLLLCFTYFQNQPILKNLIQLTSVVQNKFRNFGNPIHLGGTIVAPPISSGHQTLLIFTIDHSLKFLRFAV